MSMPFLPVPLPDSAQEEKSPAGTGPPRVGREPAPRLSGQSLPLGAFHAPSRQANRGPIHVLAFPSTAMSAWPWDFIGKAISLLQAATHSEGEGEPLAAALGRNRAWLPRDTRSPSLLLSPFMASGHRRQPGRLILWETLHTAFL